MHYVTIIDHNFFFFFSECERELVGARKQTTSEQLAFAEVTSRSSASKAAANRPKKIAGASLVNPSAKRSVHSHCI